MLDFQIQNSDLCNLEEELYDIFSKSNCKNVLDESLAAFETGDLSHLVKEELKCTIQTRRLAKGQDELKVDFSEEIKYQLTEDEQNKIVRRREQNRMAARRFRKRRKQNKKTLSEIQDIERDNDEKTAEIKRLREEKETLLKLLNDHLLVCPGIQTTL
ncbi:cyclic AMP-dependent transcription factor ATF-3-like [Mytilus trossulus]|uniref:cyclic AMP-dependent transcription factor ATF-3-like n=1 Tax=Mytilus trossulus TaxID=6551 RepID=UPI0030074D29